MSEEKEKTSIFQHNPWNVYLGDCSVVTNYLNNKPVASVWAPLHTFNIFLRAVGQVETSCNIFHNQTNVG